MKHNVTALVVTFNGTVGSVGLLSAFTSCGMVSELVHNLPAERTCHRGVEELAPKSKPETNNEFSGVHLSAHDPDRRGLEEVAGVIRRARQQSSLPPIIQLSNNALWFASRTLEDRVR
jgi:hypothetical protein